MIINFLNSRMFWYFLDVYDTWCVFSVMKVVLACITPKYVVSHHCNRELSLADLLNKTIIPIMFEEVPWPPPGGMSLIFSQLIYINMKGTEPKATKFMYGWKKCKILLIWENVICIKKCYLKFWVLLLRSRFPWYPVDLLNDSFINGLADILPGVGGHGGTGIHADLKDKYKEIVQKLMNYIVPDLTKYFDTETVISKQFSADSSSIMSEPYSPPIATETAISYQAPRPEVRQQHVSFAQQEAYVPPPAPPHYQAREQTPVSQSCVCAILWWKVNFIPWYIYIIWVTCQKVSNFYHTASSKILQVC